MTCDDPQGQLRRYYRFRADRWYGGVATGDVVGCGLMCRFCWASDSILERPSTCGQFLPPSEAARRLIQAAESSGFGQVRLSGGEPTIGRPHLLQMLSEVEKAGRFRFILETNGILLGADSSYCEELAAFECLHARVSLKGASEIEFETMTGARGDGFALQLAALGNLSRARVGWHPAVMSSFSTDESMGRLQDRISSIDSKAARDLEVEQLIQYPRVKRRLRRFGLVPRVSHQPGNVPEYLI